MALIIGNSGAKPVIEKGKLSFCTYPQGGAPTVYLGNSNSYSNNDCNYFGYGILNADGLTSLTVTTNHVRAGAIIGYTGGIATRIASSITGTAVDISNYDTVAFIIEYSDAFAVTVTAS